ncbi:MAG: SagB/ThcOx family dehydrogenase [Candidatus Melainabacteria bacterium]|nr:SagB/ThcOx family dehydrogenase [Candidatus Melainabacteria bacterium]
MSTYESYAEYYHDLTKYTPEGIASSQHRLDLDKQPAPFKEYPNKKIIDLSYLLPLDRNPFSDIGIKNPKDFTPCEKSLAALSKLLYFSNGVTAVIPYLDKPFYMRSSPSAGGLYPTEIYICTKDYVGLEDGIYNYQVYKQALAQVYKGDLKEKFAHATFNHPACDISSGKVTLPLLILVLTGVFYRSSWRYQDRAYRRICLDTGHIIGNLDLVSSTCDFKPILIGGFNDKLINEILLLDEEEEQALAVIPLINKNIETDFNFPSALPSKLDNQNIKTPEGNRLIQLHQRSRIDKYVTVPNISIENVEEKFKFSSKLQFNKKAKDFKWKETLYSDIIRRRSTRAFSGESITKEELGAILEFAYHPELFADDGLDPRPVYFDLSLLQTFVAVNSVNGLEEGCYYYSKEGPYLRQVRFKNFRDEIYYLCLGQELGHKASAVIFHTSSLSKAVFKYGERAYRYLHMDSGHLGQRINVAAINLDLGVSGIGGFFDDQVNEVLGIPENEAVLYITTLGVPLKSKQ